MAWETAENGLLIIGSQVRALVRPPPQAPVPQRFFSFLASVFCRDNFGVAPIWHRLGVSWKEHHSRHLPTSSYFVLRPESERMLGQWPRGTTHVHDKAAKVEVAATVTPLDV